MRIKIFNFFKLLFALIFALASCNLKKKYYYKEDNKAEKLMEASSDSAAYMEAFKNFEISKKVYNDMKQSLGSTYLDRPISFELLNDKHEDITYKITFTNKDSLEKTLANSINDLPNDIEASVTKAREEKNGVGAMYDTGGLYLAPVKVLGPNLLQESTPITKTFL